LTIGLSGNTGLLPAQGTNWPAASMMGEFANKHLPDGWNVSEGCLTKRVQHLKPPCQAAASKSTTF
jgi:hypothetical protein